MTQEQHIKIKDDGSFKGKEDGVSGSGERVLAAHVQP